MRAQEREQSAPPLVSNDLHCTNMSICCVCKDDDRQANSAL